MKAPRKEEFDSKEEYEQASLANLEKSLKRFKGLVQKENILLEYRRHAYYIPKTERRREKIKKGIRKQRKRERIEQE